MIQNFISSSVTWITKPIFGYFFVTAWKQFSDTFSYLYSHLLYFFILLAWLIEHWSWATIKGDKC